MGLTFIASPRARGYEIFGFLIGWIRRFLSKGERATELTRKI